MKPFTFEFVLKKLSKQKTTTTLTYWNVEWPQNELVSKWNYQRHLSLGMKTINTSKKNGSSKRCSFNKILRRYNNEDVVRELEAMQKILAFYSNKNIDMWKIGATLQKLAKICLQKITHAKFCHFREGQKDLWKKIEMLLVVCLFFLNVQQMLMIFFRKSTNLFKSFVQIDASQLSPHSMCHSTPTGFYTHWNHVPETGRFTLVKRRPVTLKVWSCPIFNKKGLVVKLKSWYKTGTQEKIHCFSVDGFRPHCNAAGSLGLFL